ncbi:MAG: DNA primase [Candidatus Thermoplasmatota archaeon]|nr:DNA primase [Candidatus Thermoplasmatota archaeon]
MNLDPATTKYLIEAKLVAEGVVEKPDVVGAIFGQTEGLLGDELDLRDLQKTGRMGRIEVDITSKKGKSEGTVLIPSSLDQVETAILAAALETIDRIGPCRAKINTLKIEDVRIQKKQKIVERAKELLSELMDQGKTAGLDLTDTVRQAAQIDEVTLFGEDKCPAGPNIETSDAVIVVEGRSDVINLLKYGIKNTIAVGGTNIPPTVQKLSNEKVVTAFVDGDRGGELILKELFQVAEIDFVARAPKSLEVEELTQKQIIKSLRNKMPIEQYLEMNDLLDDFPRKEGNGKRFEERKDMTVRNKQDKREPQPVKPQPQQQERPKAQQSEPIQAPPPLKPTKEVDQVPVEITRYRDILKTLSGTLKAMLMNDNGEVVQEIAVRQLADTLKSPPTGIHAVVFDGIISQRLLDIASEQKIKYLVGSKKGNLTKEPEGVLVLSKDDINQ